MKFTLALDSNQFIRGMNSATRALKSFTGAAGHAVEKMGKFAGSMGKIGGAIGKGMHFMSNAINVGKFAYDIIKAGATYVYDVMVFKDQMIKALTVVEGTEKSAKSIYNRIMKIADLAIFSAEDTTKAFLALRNTGLNQENAEAVFAAISDIASVQVDPALALEQMSSFVRKTMSAQRLDVQSLTDSGQFNKFAEAYARRMKVSIGAASAALKSGQVKTQQALELMIDVATQGGKKKLGEATKMMGLETIAGQMESLKGILRRQVEGLFDEKTMAESLGKINTFINDNMESILHFVDVFVQAFWPPVQKVLDQLSGALGEGGFSKFLKDMEPNLVFIGKVLGFAVGLAMKFIAVTVKVMTTFSKALNGGGEGLDGFLKVLGGALDAAIFVLDLIFSAAAKLVAFLVNIVFALVSLFLPETWQKIGGYIVQGAKYLWEVISNAFLKFGELAGDIANSFIDGMWNGLKAGFKWISDKLGDLVNMLPQTVKDVLGIHSPSKIGVELGANFGNSMGLGMEKSMPMVEQKAIETSNVLSNITNNSTSKTVSPTINVYVTGTDSMAVACSVRDALRQISWQL
jgi:hypothetical protein